MSEIEINKVKYRLGKMDSRTAVHVGRRLGPALVGVMAGAAGSKGLDIEALAPLADKFATMDNDTVDYVIDNCLAVVERETEAGTWTKIVAANGRSMFDDIDWLVTLNLTRAVVQETFSGFLPALG